MSTHWYLLLIGLILVIGNESIPVSTDDANERINYLLNKTEFSKNWDELIDEFTGDNENLSNYVSILKSFLNKFFSFEKLRPQLAKIYGEIYTKIDINKLIKFYDSPIGKKMLENQDIIYNRLSDYIQEEFSGNTDEFNNWVAETLANDESGAFAKLLRAIYILIS